MIDVRRDTDHARTHTERGSCTRPGVACPNCGAGSQAPRALPRDDPAGSGHADTCHLAAATGAPTNPALLAQQAKRRVLGDQPDTGFLRIATDERLTASLCRVGINGCRGLGSFTSPADINHGWRFAEMDSWRQAAPSPISVSTLAARQLDSVAAAAWTVEHSVA